eukprot:m.12766 g.12766  ORF g.12766 m.12766 type:complete len:491 (+) comp8197_c0_seq1:36-1508(+)
MSWRRLWFQAVHQPARGPRAPGEPTDLIKALESFCQSLATPSPDRVILLRGCFSLIDPLDYIALRWAAFLSSRTQHQIHVSLSTHTLVKSHPLYPMFPNISITTRLIHQLLERDSIPITQRTISIATRESQTMLPKADVIFDVPTFNDISQIDETHPPQLNEESIPAELEGYWPFVPSYQTTADPLTNSVAWCEEEETQDKEEDKTPGLTVTLLPHSKNPVYHHIKALPQLQITNNPQPANSWQQLALTLGNFKPLATFMSSPFLSPCINDTPRPLPIKNKNEFKRFSKNPRPFVIGLTGGIASGKSSAAKRLKELGAYVIDADRLGHQVLDLEAKKIVSVFGQQILDEANQTVCRQKLGAVVFGQAAKMEQLNAIAWPAIGNLLEKELLEIESPVVVLEAAVLLEAGWQKQVDEVWCTFVSEPCVVRRLQERNALTEDEAWKRIEAQMPIQAKLEQSHVRICTFWKPEITQRQIIRAWNQLMEIRLPKI